MDSITLIFSLAGRGKNSSFLFSLEYLAAWASARHMKEGSYASNISSEDEDMSIWKSSYHITQ